MRRWMLLALITLSILGIFIAIVVVIARQQPLPDDLTRFHLTDCELPCWIGITLGVTTMQEAKEKVLQIYGTDYDDIVEGSTTISFSYKKGSTQDPGPYFTVQIVSSFQHPAIVSGINFYRFEFPTLANLHNLLGAPYGIVVAPDMRYVGLLYRNMNYTLEVGYDSVIHDRLDLKVQAVYISIRNGAEKCLTPWRGFRILQLYYSSRDRC